MSRPKGPWIPETQSYDHQDHNKHLTKSQMCWSTEQQNLSQADHDGTKVAHYKHVNYLHMKYTYSLEYTNTNSSLHKYAIITLLNVET